MARLQDPCKSIIRRRLCHGETQGFIEILERNRFYLFKCEIYDNRHYYGHRIVKYVYRNHEISVEFQLFVQLEDRIAVEDRILE